MTAATGPAPAARLSAAPDPRRALRRAWPLLRPHRAALAGAALVSLTATAAELAVPVLVGAAVDAIVAADRALLHRVVAAAGLLAAAQLGLESARRRSAARASERVLADLRRDVAAALLARPLAFFDANPPGELLARATADVDELSGFARNSLRQLLDALLLLAVTLAVVLAASWQLALIAGLYLPLAALAIVRYRPAATAAKAADAQAYADTTAAVTEAVTARTTLQAAGAQRRFAARLAAADGRLLATNATVLRADNRLSINGWWQNLTLAAVVVAGGVLAQRGAISVGAVAAVALALRHLFGPLDSLAWLYGRAVAARANLARVLELLDAAQRAQLTADTDQTSAAAAAGDRGGGQLQLDRVSFAYDGGGPVLREATLRVEAGEHIAVVGPSGAGKSTMAKLAAGLLVPQAGRVTLDGAGVWTRPGRRRRVVLIPQEGHVAAGTLADNLRLVPGRHTDEDLARAVETAGLSGWVASLPAGLDTVLAARGANLSAGERQLVGLARAALADPDVLILDEATADVDPVTEAVVAGALSRLGAGRTLIVVAHRPATAARAARTVVLDGGRVLPTRAGMR